MFREELATVKGGKLLHLRVEMVFSDRDGGLEDVASRWPGLYPQGTCTLLYLIIRHGRQIAIDGDHTVLFGASCRLLHNNLSTLQPGHVFIPSLLPSLLSLNLPMLCYDTQHQDVYALLDPLTRLSWYWLKSFTSQERE